MIEDAFTQSDHAINITDPKGILIRVNEAYLRLYKFKSSTDVLGRTQSILRSPATPSSLYKEMWETITAGEVWRGELTNRATDGTEVPIHLTISPIRRGGRIIGYMGFSIDRAQQVVLERQLFHANKLVVLGTLGAGLAHELNNPLASILLDAEYLREAHASDTPVDREQALAAAESVIRGAERMRRVLEHLLLYSKKDSGLASSAVRIKDLLEDSFLFIERQLVSRGINIRIDVAGDPYVNGNRTQLESVIHNLLSNSRDAFAEKAISGKRIAITATLDESGTQVTVDYRDNAGGIPSEALDKVFEPFFTTKGGEGTGLGLSISRKILSDHNGTIHCESTSGETLFRIALPGFSMQPAGGERGG